jgi:hypothetical protein
MSLLASNPSPSNRDSTASVGEAHHQQLMPGANLELPSTTRRISPPLAACFKRDWAIGSNHSLTLIAEFSNRRLNLRVAEGRVALLVGIALAIFWRGERICSREDPEEDGSSYERE